MKTLSLIVFFWISFLTVQPAVAGICEYAFREKQECCMKECCSSEDMPCKEDAANNCCGNGICNPCPMCYCCFGATMEKPGVSFNLTDEKNNLFVFVNEESSNGYPSTCFQPPELI